MTTQNRINSKTVIVQKLSTSIATLVTCSTALPADDTIPQSTEGTQILTLAITPTYSTSRLYIVFTGIVVNDANGNSITTALFQDSTANALAAVSLFTVTTANTQTGTLRYVMTSGTTSSTTFKIRVGPNANTCYVNGTTGGVVLMGGVSNTTLTITEML